MCVNSYVTRFLSSLLPWSCPKTWVNRRERGGRSHTVTFHQKKKRSPPSYPVSVRRVGHVTTDDRCFAEDVATTTPRRPERLRRRCATAAAATCIRFESQFGSNWTRYPTRCLRYHYLFATVFETLPVTTRRRTTDTTGRVSPWPGVVDSECPKQIGNRLTPINATGATFTILEMLNAILLYDSLNWYLLFENIIFSSRRSPPSVEPVLSFIPRQGSKPNNLKRRQMSRRLTNHLHGRKCAFVFR